MKENFFSLFLTTISSEPLYVIDKKLGLNEYVPIDLSINNKELLKINVNSSIDFEKFINNFLNKTHKKLAYGGYLEQRNIYNRSSHFNLSNSENDRNIHLGIDFWCNSGTKVLAVLDGEIHSFKNNAQIADYGPTIIIKHIINDIEFYSLYGHLSMESLDNLKVGQQVYQGEVIASLGNASVNGDYAPHLHFQLIKDIQDNFGDYPGVSSKNDLLFYKENCPDPNLLLKI